MMFSHAEFADLSNRSEYAFCHSMGVPAGVVKCVFENLDRPSLAAALLRDSWAASGTAARRNHYQRALAAWAKANPQNGAVDMVQMRALEHLSFLDRLLWRAFEALQCRREYVGTRGDKAWNCMHHGMNRGDSQPCKAAYEGWVAAQNY